MTPRTLLLAFLISAGSAGASPGAEFVFFYEHVLGTSLEVRIAARDAGAAEQSARRLLDEIERLRRVLSNHDASSEFRVWQEGQAPVRPVSLELYGLLAQAEEWRIRSGGAFDIRAEVFSRIWVDAQKRGRVPTALELSEGRRQLSAPAYRLHSDTRQAERLTGVPLSLDGIAKGEIVERAARAACDPQRGVEGVLVNLGGDMRVCGSMERVIGIADPAQDSESTPPVARVRARDRSIATSGSSQRGFWVEGRWYSHIVDPRSGQPVDHVASATVIAPRGAEADALATIANVLPVEETLRLVDSVEQAACLLVLKDGRIITSPRWALYDAGDAGADLHGAAGDPTVKRGDTAALELEVQFEINRAEGMGGPYRRPYVVVFIEDERGRSVRTLVLWVSLGGSGPDRWLPDLTRWFRENEAQPLVAKKNMIYTTARPTRPAGKYSAIWDWKDDAGKVVGPGVYTISIEAARENGTHQLIRKKVTLGDEPFVEELAGNVEIQSAKLEYRPARPAAPAR
jgi:thiamine biosynthesis lipoprotein ApbE